MNLRFRLVVVLALVASVLAGCSGGEGTTTTAAGGTTGEPAVVSLASDFTNGSDGWAADISDYSEATRPEDFLAQTGVAPPGLGGEGTDFFHLSATNRSDDLFVYLFRRLTMDDGVVPGKTYEANFTATFASAAQSGCAGIGGAPGESVWMKMRAVDVRPVPVGENGNVRMNIDKGGQSNAGPAATVGGVIANGVPCEEALDSDPPPYAMVTLRADYEGDVIATHDGSVWVFVGTDSGFEGRTSLYYDSIAVVLTPK